MPKASSKTTRFRWLATALLVSVSLVRGTLSARNQTSVDDTSGRAGGDIKVDAFLNLTRMSFNDTVTLTLRLSWSPEEFTLTETSAPQLDLQRLRVGSVTSKALTLSDEDEGRISQEYLYTLLPTASGNAVVRPVKFSFLRRDDSKPGSVTTPELRVSVLMPETEREGGTADWKVVSLVLLGFLGALAVVVTIAVRNRRRQAAKKRKLEEWNRLSEGLGALKTATSGSRAEFFDRLYGFLYTLLSEAGYITARKGDSDSVIAELRRATIAEEIKLPLINWLERSSTEKFSPGRGTPGESLRVYYEVDAFVREKWRSTDRSNRRPEPDTERLSSDQSTRD